MRISLALFLFLSLMHVWAQTETVEDKGVVFEKKGHYFGTFPRSRGKVSYSFKFTNTSGKPVKVNNVRSSCGCTVAEYTRDLVMPGEQGQVRATFDPARRSGYFSKRITVYTSDSKEPQYLTITGRIRVNDKIADNYRKRIAPFNVNEEVLDFGERARRDEAVFTSIQMINMNLERIDFEVESYPEWLEGCAASEYHLEQGLNSLLEAKVNTSKVQWGESEGTVRLRVDHNNSVRWVSVPVRLTVIDDFEEVEGKGKPQLELSSDTIRIVCSGEKAGKMKVEFFNTGDKDLYIRNVQSSGDKVEVLKFDEKPVASGKSGRMVVACKPGDDIEEIVVWTNDPDEYRKSLYVITVKE